MARERNAVVDWLQYIGLRIVSMMLHCWPVDANLRTAQYLGDLMFAIDRRHRERAVGNLRRCFPEMPQKQVEWLARRSMRALFMFFVEVLFTVRLVRIDTWASFVELTNFREVVKLLMDRQRGLILLSAHYGNFEILGYMLATMGFPTYSVFRPLDNPYVNKWLHGVRETRGQKIIAKKGATMEVADVLEQRGAVGFVADQNAGAKGLFVPFFGRLASTYKSIGLLAMQYNVPVVIGYARRLDGRFRFQVGAQDIIYPEDWQNQDDPLRYITQRYTKAIEAFVAGDPGQYWWIHRRWKTRPKGEAPEKYD